MSDAPRFYIVNQHIRWLKQYIEGMSAGNWRDMRDMAERQLESLSQEIDKADAAFPDPAQGTWMPIKTAPRDGTAILATGGGLDDSIQIVSYLEHVGAWETSEVTFDDRDNEADGYNRPTHWQHLPEALSTPLTPSTERG